MTPERARAAKAAGITSVSVSLDGLHATHDRLRGVEGSFQSALAAMDALSAAGVSVTCNTQINRLTLPELPELLETIARHGARSWQIQLAPSTRCGDFSGLATTPTPAARAALGPRSCFSAKPATTPIVTIARSRWR